jgi:exonuclease-1
MSYLREGNVELARECFQKAVDITPQMAHNLIKMLREHRIEYIVAPYEADAQLAFLALGNHVDCVITEDSDLLAYGCPRVCSFILALLLTEIFWLISGSFQAGQVRLC